MVLLGAYSAKTTLRAWWEGWGQTTACSRSETFGRMLHRNHGGAAPARSARMRRRGWRSLMRLGGNAEATGRTFMAVTGVFSLHVAHQIRARLKTPGRQFLELCGVSLHSSVIPFRCSQSSRQRHPVARNTRVLSVHCIHCMHDTARIALFLRADLD